MRMVLVVLLFSLLPGEAHCQRQAEHRERKTLASLSFSQIVNTFWGNSSQGYLALKAAMNHRRVEVAGPIEITASANADLAVRKNWVDGYSFPIHTDANQFFAEMTLAHNPCGSVHPSLNFSLRTPITESFKAGSATLLRIENLWDPVTTIESFSLRATHLGHGYDLQARLGFGFKQIRAEVDNVVTDDPLTQPKERYKSESGVDLVCELRAELDSGISLRSRIDVFGPLHHASSIVGSASTEFTLQIWKSFSLLISVELALNTAQGPRLQYRELGSFGLVQEF